MGRKWLFGALFGALGLASILGACGDDPVPAAVPVTAGGSTSATTTASSASSSVGSGGMGGSMGNCEGGMGGGGGDSEEPEWCCLGGVNYPPPAAATVDIGVSAIAFFTNAALDDVAVKACARADTACASPVAEGVTDGDGKITLALPTGASGFDGFFDVSGGGIVPAVVFFFPPLGEDKDDVEVQLVTTAIYPLLQTSVGFTPDPARGDLVALATDCNGEQAPGVQLAATTADADSIGVYVEGMAPNVEATETDVSGVAGFFKLPAGAVDISATRAVDAAPIGTISVFIRPASITYTTMPPTP